MPESREVWHPLRDLFKEMDWHATRFEQLGIPDVNVHIPTNGDIWIELKHVPNPPVKASSGIEIGLRKEQYIWMKEAKKAGRNVWLLALVGAEWWAWDDARAWELAKHRNSWSEIQRYGRMFRSHRDFIVHLISLP